MSFDLLWKPKCSVCGSTDYLYGSKCKHMILCFSCGRTMTENHGKCIECGVTLTRLIRVEGSKGFSGQSRICSSQLSLVGFDITVESPASLIPAANMFPLKTPCTAPVSVGVIRPAPPLVSVSALASASSMNHLSVNEVQPAVVLREPSSGSLEKDSSSTLPRTEVAHFRLDGRLNGPAFASQVRENTSGDHQLGKAPRLGKKNMVSDHTPIKTKGSSNISSSQVALQAAKVQSSKPFVIQTVCGSLPSVQQPSLGIHFIHNDIARNVQKFLQPRIPEHPNWTPPSVKYMNKALTCQICKATISDVESLLVCDACEKGVHLKCLHLCNKKSIPKGVWHCPKCILSSDDKPLPPRYGPVM